MKTILFFFALLAGVTASATVTVTPISTDNANKKVTFKVEWTGSPANNRVWVFIDLCPIEGVTLGTYGPAAVTAASVVGSYYTDLNGRGFYIYTSPATVTATLSIAAPDGFNWCAHGSDFPPNAIDNGSGLYTLKGTPPFIITTASGNVQVPGYTFAGGEILELTDATGCPGVFCGKNGEAPGLLNCCVSGTTDCNGTCKTNGTYTTNDGLCTGSCASAYVQSRDQCGVVKNSKYSTYSNAACADGCGPVYSTACKANIPDGHYVNMGQHVHYWADVAFNDCVSICKGLNAKTWALELWVCEWGSNVQPCYGCHCCS